MKVRSTIAGNVVLIMSLETNDSLETARIFFNSGSWDAVERAALISSLVVGFLETKVRSAKEPQTTGTRTAMPSNLFSNSDIILVVVLAAPVVDGIIFCAPALPRKKSSPAETSTKD